MGTCFHEEDDSGSKPHLLQLKVNFGYHLDRQVCLGFTRRGCRRGRRRRRSPPRLPRRATTTTAGRGSSLLEEDVDGGGDGGDLLRDFLDARHRRRRGVGDDDVPYLLAIVSNHPYPISLDVAIHSIIIIILSTDIKDNSRRGQRAAHNDLSK